MTETLHDPEQLMHRWADAVNRNDAGLLADVFADDAEFVNLFGSVWRGRDAIIAGHCRALESVLQHSTMRIDEIERRSINDGAAVLRGVCRRGRAAGASEQTLPPGTTVLLLVVRRERDTWRAVAGANVAQQSPES